MSSSGIESLAHVHAIERPDPAPRVLVPTESTVDPDVLDHQLVGVELDNAVPAPPRFGLEEVHQEPPDSFPLPLGIDGDVVEEKQIARPLDHHQQPGHGPVSLDDPGLAVGDARRVVVEHRTRLLTETGHVVAVAALDQGFDGRAVVGDGGSDMCRGLLHGE